MGACPSWGTLFAERVAAGVLEARWIGLGLIYCIGASPAVHRLLPEPMLAAILEHELRTVLILTPSVVPAVAVRRSRHDVTSGLIG